jgi:hypothetical protein
MPREMAVLIWFAADDSSTSPRAPVYASSTKVAKPYAGQGTQDGVPFDIFNFDLDKAFWVQNLLSNFAYSRWKDAYPMIRKKIDEVQERIMGQVEQLDEKALAVYQDSGPIASVEMLTNFSVTAGESLHKEWTAFFGEVFTRFRDFSVIIPNEADSRGFTVGSPGLSDETKRRVVMETGTHYEVPVLGEETRRFRGNPREQKMVVDAVY